MNDELPGAAAPPDSDFRALAALILELNIARRNSRAYPKGHQVIEASLAKVLKSYAGVSDAGELALGVAGEALFAGEAQLEKGNPVFRDFARVLHERGIAALFLRRGLVLEELRRFITILGARREDVLRAGGIEQVWEKSGIKSIGIRAIRYDLFGASETGRLAPDPGSDPAGLWDRFARGMAGGLLHRGGEDRESLDPELLAELLNQRYGGEGATLPLEVVGHLLNGLLEAARFAAPPETVYRQLAGFVAKLNPALRRQFLASAFDLTAQGGAPAAEGLVSQLPLEVVLETLGEVNQRQLNIPPFVLGLLQQMGSRASGDAAAGAFPPGDEGLQDKMRVIFREHAMEEFIPDSYQAKLQKMMSGGVPELGTEEVGDLLETVEAAAQEKKTSDILLLLLKSGDASPEGYAALARNLHDIGTFFLQTGDYAELLKILHQMDGDGVPAVAREELRALFSSRGFLEEVLDGLDTWGKPKFDEIARVIAEIGAPFIGPLLDRLAGTESMSLRRFLVDRLAEFGHLAGPALVERLSDGRWYFLRNLIGVIRQLNYTPALDRLRALARHRDPRVWQEALRALLQFGDQEAEQRLLNDLESQNRELQLAALRVAGRSSSPVLVALLHEMLSRPGLSAREHEVKSLTVQALAEIGNPGSLAVLDAVLGSRSILHPVLLNKLKLEIVSTLGHYPSAASGPLLARLAAGKGAVARQAAQLWKSTGGRSS